VQEEEDKEDEEDQVEQEYPEYPEPPEDQLDKQEKEAEEEKQNNKKLYVNFEDSTITEQDLLNHFQQFGEVESIAFDPMKKSGIVTFTNAISAAALDGKEHVLLRGSERGGCAAPRLRLATEPCWPRGGSGRGAGRVPPLQLRLALNAFRYQFPP
jgi:RNA recognition motif-containing protein